MTPKELLPIYNTNAQRSNSLKLLRNTDKDHTLRPSPTSRMSSMDLKDLELLFKLVLNSELKLFLLMEEYKSSVLTSRKDHRELNSVIFCLELLMISCLKSLLHVLFSPLSLIHLLLLKRRLVTLGLMEQLFFLLSLSFLESLPGVTTKKKDNS